jgi:hypothetical protein
MGAVIRQTPKMCLAFKSLAASRLCADQEQVAAAFRFAFAQIKPHDAVVVGMFPEREDQIALNVGHTLAACGGWHLAACATLQQPAHKLDESRLTDIAGGP